jgi:glycosyltransferase involved in cell wall biosynthesis
MAAQSQALRDCDCVIIPATVDNAQKRAKTANRLTEALWAGRPVLAHAVPSYLEFAHCAWIGEDLVAGLGVALRNPQQVLRQVRAGQDIVAARYSPEAVGGLWAQALRGV